MELETTVKSEFPGAGRRTDTSDLIPDGSGDAAIVGAATQV
jgi:hypothetical protein